MPVGAVISSLPFVSMEMVADAEILVPGHIFVICNSPALVMVMLPAFMRLFMPAAVLLTLRAVSVMGSALMPNVESKTMPLADVILRGVVAPFVPVSVMSPLTFTGESRMMERPELNEVR